MHATEVHDVRAFTVNNNGEYGTFFLREFQRQREDGSTAYSAELTANTSFGAVGYYWSAMGCPAKEFFKKTDMHYLGTKLWGASSRLFDCDETLQNIRSDLLAQRRQKLMDKDEAMAIWDDLQSLEHCSSQDEFRHMMGDLSHIDEWLPANEVPFGTRPNPQLVGFFKELWPAFVEAIQTTTEASSDQSGK